jgi:signal transduction histidine kinase
MEFAEVRHLEGIVGNFEVSKRDYIATISGTTEKSQYVNAIENQKTEPLTKPLFEAIHSNVKAFVDHQQFFFETLWNRAMPAEQRIEEIEQGIIPEKTEIIYGLENIVNRIFQTMSLIKERVDNCGDSNLPGIFASTTPVMDAYMALKNRGIKLRFITEITKENIPYCRKIMAFAEMRHMDGVKGNFGVTDNEFMANAAVPRAPEPLQQVVYSTVKAFVQQQQYSFQNLWDRAVPAEQKIREIEEGIVPDVIETIRDPERIQELGIKLVSSAETEIMILFSAINAFRRKVHEGMIQVLGETALARPNLRIKILSPADDYVKAAIYNLIEKDTDVQPRIAIRNLPPPSQTRVSILVVDRKFSLAVELKDDTETSFVESTGLATFSNSKATVLSYVSIFESLWVQTELYGKISESNQELQILNTRLQVHDKMQEEFINVAAHELRTPIQPILGLSEVLRTKAASCEQRRFLDAIIMSAQRLQQLTDDVLDVARIEGHSLVLRKEEANLTKIIKESINSLESQLNGTRIKLSVKENHSKARIHVYTPILVDTSRIAQVMTNLLSNAIKFTKKGLVVVSIEKGVNHIQVSVRDAGSGIDPEILPRLFTKFATKSERGTGLGLFISKSIIEAHGGKIWADNNKDGKGATFTFTLPLRVHRK